MQHFEALNTQQSEDVYHFHFLTPKDYDKFFKFVRNGNYDFVSELDVALEENGSSSLSYPRDRPHHRRTAEGLLGGKPAR